MTLYFELGSLKNYEIVGTITGLDGNYKKAQSNTAHSRTEDTVTKRTINIQQNCRKCIIVQQIKPQ